MWAHVDEAHGSCWQDDRYCDDFSIPTDDNCHPVYHFEHLNQGNIDIRKLITDALRDKCLALNPGNTGHPGPLPTPVYWFKSFYNDAFLQEEIWSNRSWVMGIKESDKANWQALGLNFFSIRACTGNAAQCTERRAIQHHQIRLGMGAWQIL